jgi:hypothetical protein
MAKRILTGTKRKEVTAAALERNVGMQQRGRYGFAGGTNPWLYDPCVRGN